MDHDHIPAVITRALEGVEAPSSAWAERAAERQARLTMPPGSLGRLLDLGQQLASIQRTDQPHANPSLVAVFAADHGVAVHGVSAYPPAVTGQMIANYLAGGAAVNVLARNVGAALRVADLGAASLPSETAAHERLVRRPIGPGTRDLLQGPAMTRDEAYQAVSVGLELADAWYREQPYRVVALGEMGIGNTTTASILLAALTGAAPDRVVGRGTGIDEARLYHKREVVTQALVRHPRRSDDLWHTLSSLGGFEILGLAGFAIGAARKRALVVLDGLISSVAGLVAARLSPLIRGSLVASHLGPEPGHRIILEELGLTPLLQLGLRLGEGTGATLALPLIAAAADILRDMATFESAQVSGPIT